jgi:hypothetical protein
VAVIQSAIRGQGGHGFFAPKAVSWAGLVFTRSLGLAEADTIILRT